MKKGVSKEALDKKRKYDKERLASFTPEQKEARRKYQRERYRKDRCRDLKRLYGITQKDYDLMLQAQGHRCAICGSKDTGRKTVLRFSVDHDHLTGKVRGLLCHHCNQGLGAFRDNTLHLAKAITYLEDRS